MMTQPDATTQRTPIPCPRITALRVAGRTWLARTEGAGCGAAWGQALAALDYRSHATTDGCHPTFWIDEDALRVLIVECSRLGVRVEAVDGTQLPTALVR